MKTLVLLASFSFFALSVRADDPANIPDDAPPVGQIAHVLNQLIAAMNRAAAKPDNNKYADDLIKISVTKCPADFQAAWKKFREANVEFLTHNKIPEVFLDLAGIIHGDTKGVQKGLERADDLKAATLELKAVCKDYGIDASHVLQ